MGSPASKLALGTVQFGAAYGVTNRFGQVPAADVARIVAIAVAGGITLLDTAASYGDSETVLGEVAENRPILQFVSKIPAIASATIGPAEIDACRTAVYRSLERLRRPSLYGLLLHGPDDLDKPGYERLVELMKELKSAGAAARIGVSAYERRQLARAASLLQLDLIQTPCSLLDQRLLNDGTLRQLKGRGVEIHARSAFLQGVLLAEPGALPGHFRRWVEPLRRVGRIARDAGMSRLALSLRFALDRPEIDQIVVGVSRAAELTEIIDAASSSVPLPAGLESLAIDDPDLLNPARWPAM